MIPSAQIGWDQNAKLLWQISKQLERLISVTYNTSLPNPLLNILNQNLVAQTANLWITGSAKAGTFNGLTITNNGTNVLNIAAGQSLIVPVGGTLGTAAYTNSTAYEVISNKATTFNTINDTLYPTVKAVSDAIISAVIGLLDYRGPYDASVNLFPATGGSGTAGAILKGDFWIVSVAGTLGGTSVTVNDLAIALYDVPGQTAGNWTLQQHTFSYTPENITNKVTSISALSTDVQYPSAKLLYDQLAGKGVGDMLLGTIQSVTAEKKFIKDKISMLGTSTGKTIFSTANIGATDYTQTFQAKTGTVANLDDILYIGTTSVPLNNPSGALVLTGVTTSMSNITLLNDQWITTLDYAGNLANLIKLSKDNIVEFGAPVGIDAFYHVLNSGFNDIVNIPVDITSPAGTQHGVGITVGGQRIFTVSTLSDGAGGVDNINITTLGAFGFTSGTLLAIPVAGKVEFLTDKFYATQTTGATRKEIKLVDQYYAEMYAYENTNITTIGTQNIYHAIAGSGLVTGLLSGFTFVIGINGTIASVADYNGTVAGTILVTDVAHGLATGDIVTIHSTTDYNGTFSITKVTNDTFYVTETYTSSQTGVWAMGAYLRCSTGSDGVYRVSWNTTSFSANPNETFKFELNKGTAPLDNIAGSSKYISAADYRTFGASGLVSLVVGDRIWLSVRNETSGADITVRHANINITRN